MEVRSTRELTVFEFEIKSSEPLLVVMDDLKLEGRALLWGCFNWLVFLIIEDLELYISILPLDLLLNFPGLFILVPDEGMLSHGQSQCQWIPIESEAFDVMEGLSELTLMHPLLLGLLENAGFLEDGQCSALDLEGPSPL